MLDCRCLQNSGHQNSSFSPHPPAFVPQPLPPPFLQLLPHHSPSPPLPPATVGSDGTIVISAGKAGAAVPIKESAEVEYLTGECLHVCSVVGVCGD